jgi:hypothetical protein
VNGHYVRRALFVLALMGFIPIGSPVLAQPGQGPPQQQQAEQMRRQQQGRQQQQQEKQQPQPPHRPQQQPPPKATEDEETQKPGQPPAAEEAPKADRDTILAQLRKFADNHARVDAPLDSELMLQLYGNNDVGLSKEEIVRTYEEEYTRVKASIDATRAASRSSWFFYGGVMVAVLLGLGVFALIVWTVRHPRHAVVPSEVRGDETSRGSVGRRLAAPRLLKGYGPRRYLTHLTQTLGTFDVQFEPDRPLRLRSLFVAPRLRDPAGVEADASTIILQYPRLVIKGPPGSGKSVLLRHLALRSAESGQAGHSGEPLPVLVPLRRLTAARMSARLDPRSAATPLEQELVEELARQGFTDGGTFLSDRLAKGGVLVLLDGLNEVAASVRPRVVQQIRDLWQKYPNCRSVVTTRPFGYQDELGPAASVTLELAEFNAQQMRQFLDQWKRTLPADHPFSGEQLLRSVQDRGRLPLLVHNPLLLTMIAYLFTEAPRGLSGSRTSVYQRCLDAMLSKLPVDKTRYLKDTKIAILAYLALAFQDNAEAWGGDGRSLDRNALVGEVRKILANPKYHFPAGMDVEDLVREMVDQDQLLLPGDGGLTYQFRHRSWQEYLAGEALEEDGPGLLERYSRDPAQWVETTRFWCGLEHDSTQGVKALYETDPLTGLLCLADAERVDPELADRIVAAFTERFGEGADQDILVRAFAALSLREGHRGEALFRFLTGCLGADQPRARRVLAARALALTQLPQAAAELVRARGEDPEFRKAFLQMGDRAVGELVALARAGNTDALEDLLAIGTPAAAEGLVPLLWEPEGDLAVQAAWRLAALLSRPQIELALEHYAFAAARPKPGPYDWVWEPFTHSDSSSMPPIAGRIVTLLERAPLESAPATPPTLDPRLVLPLCAIIKKQDAWRLTEELPPKTRATVLEGLRKSLGKRINLAAPGGTGLLANGLRRKSAPAELTEARNRFSALVLHVTQPSPQWRYLIDALAPEVRFRFLYNLFEGPSPRRRDWLEMRRPAGKVRWGRGRETGGGRNPLRASLIGR